MEKKYIIFDFDGTLVDSLNIAIAAGNKLADKYKFKKVQKEDIDCLRGLSVIERCKYISVPVYKLPFWAVEFYSIYRHSIDNLRLFDGMKELLEELVNRGYNLAIISSNSEEIIREFLQRNQIEYFNKIYCSSNLFGKDKVIKKFLNKYNVKKSEAIYVGDEHRDIVACKKNKLKIIWVEWGFDKIEVVKSENPDYIAKKPMDILNIVEAL